MSQAAYTERLHAKLLELEERIRQLERLEFAQMLTGTTGPGTLAAAEGVFFMDVTNDRLYINADGSEIRS